MPAADVELRFWFAIFGPKGLPEPVKAKLSQAIAKVMGDPRGARAPRQARHHAGRHRRPGDARQARTRDQELDPVHRRQGHQGGITGARRSAASGGAGAALSTAAACPWSNRAAGNAKSQGNPSCCASFDGARSLWRCSGRARARAGARHLSRPADQVRHRLPAGWRDRHLLPPDLQRARHRARPAGGDREQGRRRRLHRLADGRQLAEPTATRCWWRRTRSASTRRCSRSIRPASIR